MRRRPVNEPVVPRLVRGIQLNTNIQIQITPTRIKSLNQIKLPLPTPVFQTPFTSNHFKQILMLFIIHKLINVIFRCKSYNILILMLPYTLFYIRCGATYKVPFCLLARCIYKISYGGGPFFEKY